MTLLVVLVCVASYRLTRLLVVDAITEGPRDWVERRFGEESSWAYLVNCPWCVGVWISAGVTLATDLLVDGGLVAPPLVFGAAAATCGWMTVLEPEP